MGVSHLKRSDWICKGYKETMAAPLGDAVYGLRFRA